MTDSPDTPATPVADTGGRVRRLVSAVWLVPVVALLIAFGIAWQSYSDRGELVAIAFPDASGIQVGETTLRYREVAVGVVEDVGFSADLQEVNVYVRVNRSIAPYLDESASFWIVQPEVTTRGVQGLNTILSGTYIQGTWDSELGEAQTAFVGAARAPVVPPGVRGTAIVLRARDSARLGPGAPILYRGIQVGEVAEPRLSPDGTEIRIDAFVRSPYDRRLSTATRFWDASGVSVELGAGGVDLNIGSVAALLEGGISFDTLISGGEPIESGHLFNIFEDERAARASTFETPSARSVTLSALFPSAAAGLTEGAPVRFQGVRVGVVTRITGFIREDDPTAQVQLLAVLSLQPSTMGLEDFATELDGIDYIGDLVAEGLRAQLVPTSLLGGSLAVELSFAEDLFPAALEIGVADNPLIPTVEAEEGGLQATAAGVLERIDGLPIEEVLGSARDLLDNVNRIVADDATRAIPAEVVALLEGGQGLVRDGRAILSAPEVASVLLDVQTIANDLEGIVATIAEREVAGTLADTLASADGALANVAEGTAELPELITSARTALDSANGLLDTDDTRALPGLARETLEGARDLTTAPEIAAILSDTAAAVAQVRAITDGFAGTALATQVETLLIGVDEAVRNVAAGTADLGTLRGALDNVIGAAETFLASAETQALPAEALALLEDGRSLVGGPEVQQVLTGLATVSADISALTRELVAQDAAARLSEALEAAAAAATAVAAGTDNLPAITESTERVLAQAEVLATGLTALTEKANALALDELVNSTTALMRSADAFISSDEADDVPVVLSATLEELRRTIEVIRTGGTLDNLNTTLRSASGAADSIRTTAADLPDLVSRLQVLLGQAGGVLEAYGEESRVNQELFAALRAATRAAEDVSSLSRTIERNPQSLILGR
ncbi:MAG: MlaD family protein [Pseudomonadota bacterium]